MKNNARAGGKMEPRRDGPYWVKDINDKGNCVLENCETKKQLRQRIPLQQLDLYKWNDKDVAKLPRAYEEQKERKLLMNTVEQPSFIVLKDKDEDKGSSSDSAEEEIEDVSRKPKFYSQENCLVSFSNFFFFYFILNCTLFLLKMKEVDKISSTVSAEEEIKEVSSNPKFYRQENCLVSFTKFFFLF